jgi:hypothetical protein
VTRTFALMIALSLLGGMMAFAQGRAVEANVVSLSGSVTLTNTTRSAALRRGDKLVMGDVIETTAGARLVLALSDGSQMIVYELSRVVMKDFRYATSLRELQITWHAARDIPYNSARRVRGCRWLGRQSKSAPRKWQCA